MNKKGFTLTEILIVLVVAGILLALILPNTLKAIERAEVTQLSSDLNTIQVGLFMCFTENRNWDDCDSLGELVDGDFIDGDIETAEKPFDVDYDVQEDTTTSTGAQVACYSGGTVPQDVQDDDTLTECGGGGA